MKYGLSDKQLQEIAGIISSYSQIEQALIFGSRAIDTYKEASDVDIAIKGSKADSKLAAALKDQLEEETYLPFFFDVIAYHSVQSEELKKHIRTKGKSIYRKSLEGWREVNLGDVAEIFGGFAFKSKDFSAIGKPVVKITEIQSPYVNLKNCEKINLLPYKSKNLDKYKVQKDDYLVAMTGATIGKVGKLIEENIAYINQRVAKIEAIEKHSHNKFIYYSIANNNFVGFVENTAIGAVQPNISTTEIGEFPILLPPLPEQKAIAEVLSSLDDKIELLHRQNKTLEDMAQTLFRQWFVEQADAEWEVGKIPDEFDFIMGQSPPGKSYNEEQNGIPMFQGNADFGFRFPANRIYTTQPKRFAEKYDTLISVRAPVGEQNMAKEKCCIGRGVATFRYKNDNSFYTYTYFKMMSLIKEIQQYNQTGTVFGSISKSDFQNIEIMVPPIKLIKKFQAIAKPIDDKIISNQAQINTLENLRDTLLPKLMSGEARIRINDKNL